MADMTASFEKLADFDMWEDVGVLFAGFMAPTLLRNTLDGRLPVDVPAEAYGLGVAAGAQYGLSGSYRTMATLGGGLYTADAAAERFGVKQAIQNAGPASGSGGGN